MSPLREDLPQHSFYSVIPRLNRAMFTRVSRQWVTIAMTMCVVVIAQVGCSKEEVKQALEDATAKTKSLTESAVEAVEERLPESGSIELEMDSPGDPIKRADLELIAIGDGRPNVVQILNYDPDSNSRSYPSVMLHGTTDASTGASLAGKTIQCDMYYRASSSSPIAMTPPGQSVAVTFESMIPEDNAVTAKIGAVSLVASDDTPIAIRGGQIVAVLRGED